MLTFSPSRILIVLIVALVLVGPDKLPKLARQLGDAWTSLRRFRQRIETEVRETLPDLPSTHDIARAVRSPVAFLDTLADMNIGEGTNEAPVSDAVSDAAPDVNGSANRSEAHQPEDRSPPADDSLASSDSFDDTTADANPSAAEGGGVESSGVIDHETERPPRTGKRGAGAADGIDGAGQNSSHDHDLDDVPPSVEVGAWTASPGWGLVIPDDPSMN